MGRVSNRELRTRMKKGMLAGERPSIRPVLQPESASKLDAIRIGSPGPKARSGRYQTEKTCRRFPAATSSRGDDLHPGAGLPVESSGQSRRSRPAETAQRAANRTAPLLIATSSKPNTRSRPAGRQPRVGVHKPSGSAPRAAADGRRLPAVLLGLGLATLMGLTTWAVASVSIWLVPAYLSLIILIFTAPGARRVKSPATKPTTGSPDADVALSGRRPGSDRADGMGETHPVSDPNSSLPADEGAESSASSPDSAGPHNAKPRRSRARSRKAAKSAAELAPDSSPVTWIRVGPGQFVRADVRTPEPPQAPAEEVAPEAHSATEVPPPVTPADEVAPPADPTVDGLAAVPSVTPSPRPLAVSADPVPIDSPESPPEDERPDPSTGENPPEPPAEEYGIAPSAFGPETEDSPSSPSLVSRVSDGSVLLVADPDRTANLDGPPSNGEFPPGPTGLRRPRSWLRTAFLPRGIANVSLGRGSNVTSSRRDVRTRPGPRTASGLRSSTDLRLRQAARRAYGRTDHVFRDWRPRSPPCHGI